jgi:hypothetical protein
MCMGASVNGRSVMTGMKTKKKQGALGLAKDVADSKEVKKGYGGLAGRMIK